MSLQIFFFFNLIANDQTIWLVDEFRTPEEIFGDCKILNEFIDSPLNIDGKPLHKLIKTKKKIVPRPKKIKDPSNDEEDEPKKKAKVETGPVLSKAVSGYIFFVFVLHNIYC